MYEFIPIILILFIVIYLFSKRKDKKTKTRIAWMLLISCGAIVVAGNEFLGIDKSMDALWPFGLVAGICVIWLIALKTQQ
jgi:drug/metabolite transporter (DMT)-like permease